MVILLFAGISSGRQRIYDLLRLSQHTGECYLRPCLRLRINAPPYEVSAGEQRFVLPEQIEGAEPVVRVVQNWYEEFSDREQD